MKKLHMFALTAGLSLGNTVMAQPISEAPWLRNHLPEKITAYARIPNPMFFFTPTETPLKPLYENEKYIQSIHDVKKKLTNDINKIKFLSEKEKVAIGALFIHLRAPIEIMIEDFSDLETPPAVLVATKLDYKETEIFVTDLKKLLKDSPIQIKTKEKNKGIITFNNAPIRAQYEYQPETGKLLVTIAQKPTMLSDIINQQSPTKHSPIIEQEMQIDESGQGLFATVKMHPIMRMAIPQKYVQRASQLRIMDIQQVSIGLGVAENRAKLKAIIDMPKNGFRQLIPAYPIASSTKYYGRLDSLFSISFPNNETIEKAAEMFELTNEFKKIEQENQQKGGITFSEILTVIGRNFTFIKDDSGNYIVTDKQFDQDINQLVKTLNARGIPVSLTERELHGTVIKHLNLMPIYSYIEEQFKKQDKTAPLALSKWMVTNHYYWTIEDEAAVISSIPQPLWARKQLELSETIQSALNKHHIKNPAPFISAVFNVRNLSQSSYYQQLKLLQNLGDISDLPIDIAQYSAASTLALPRYGALALNINNSGQQLSMEYSLENGISDIFAIWQQSGKTFGISATSILAAIALPAYEDYTIRAKLTASMASVTPLKHIISEALQEGKAQTDLTNENLSTAIEAASQSLSEGQFIEVDEGTIYISLDKSGDGMLILTPEFDDSDNSVSWSCEGYELKGKHLPRACQ